MILKVIIYYKWLNLKDDPTALAGPFDHRDNNWEPECSHLRLLAHSLQEASCRVDTQSQAVRKPSYLQRSYREESCSQPDVQEKLA